jgi:hypothetical protein
MDKIQKYLKQVWTAIRRWRGERQQEKGQSVVLLAVMTIVLLLFAGMAIDAGLIYMRRIQLSRAVDAAALACVTQLPDMDLTSQRAAEFMRANGLDPDTVLIASGGGFEVTQEIPPDVEEQEIVANHIATVDARWRSRTVFMQLIGIPFVDLSATATAEYRAYIDMYTSQTGESGKTGPVNMSIFGPLQSPSYGDAYTSEWQLTKKDCSEYDPRHPTTDSNHSGEDNYIAANDTTCHTENPYHGDLPNGYPFRISVPSHVTGKVRVEILDPDTYNAYPSSTIFISETLPVTSTQTYSIGASSYKSKDDNHNGINDHYEDQMRRTDAFAIDRWDTSILKTPHSDSNQFWFVRMDENREYNATPGSYKSSCDTTTDYRLYYNSEGGKVYIATYTGQPDNSHNTDMKWVCPGGSAPQDPHSGVIGHGGFPASFEVDMDALPGIIVGDDGSRNLFMEIEATGGYSENGFDLWAGPATAQNLAAPANVNDRNVWIDRQRTQGVYNPHDPSGVVTLARGVIPFNVNQSTTYTAVLTYVPPTAAGIDICVYHWDTDVGGNSIYYTLEGYSGEFEGVLSGGNTWGPPWHDSDDLPLGCDLVSVPDSFVGGFLYARYKMGGQDTSVWRLEYQSPVGDSFVRLIN